MSIPSYLPCNISGAFFSRKLVLPGLNIFAVVKKNIFTKNFFEVHVLKVVSEVNMSQNFYYNSLALNSLMEFIQWMLLCILVIG